MRRDHRPLPCPSAAGRRSRGGFLAVALGVVLTACSGGASSSGVTSGSPSTSATALATPTPTPTPTPVPTPAPLQVPMIIQVENSPAARPQSGISQADAVYEYETEGGITRFSTLWFTDPTGQVGPVRSARIATVRLVQTYDATLMYAGAGTYVQGLLDAAGLRKYDENSGSLFRVNYRAAPHNLYTDGAHVSGLRARVAAGSVPYQLWGRTALTALPAGSTSAPGFTLAISNSEQPHFVYDPVAGGYTRTEPTGMMTDAATGKPWVMPTVVVLQVPVVTAPQVHDVIGSLGLNHTLQGTGPAQVLVGGNAWAATFTQGPSGPPSLTLADGSPAPIAPGQVLIVLVRQGTVARIG